VELLRQRPLIYILLCFRSSSLVPEELRYWTTGLFKTMNTSEALSRHDDNDVGFLARGVSVAPGPREWGNTPGTSDVGGSSVTEEIEKLSARPVSQGSAESQASQNDASSIGSDHIPTSDLRPESATFNLRQVQMLSICINRSMRCLLLFRCLDRKRTTVSIRTISGLGGAGLSTSFIYFHGKCIVQCDGWPKILTIY